MSALSPPANPVFVFFTPAPAVVATFGDRSWAADAEVSSPGTSEVTDALFSPAKKDSTPVLSIITIKITLIICFTLSSFILLPPHILGLNSLKFED